MSEDLKKTFLDEVSSLKSLTDAANLRVKYLGKKGIITAKIKSLSSLSPEERRAAGCEINELKQFIDEECNRKESLLKSAELKDRLLAEAIDITLPGKTFCIRSRTSPQQDPPRSGRYIYENGLRCPGRS